MKWVKCKHRLPSPTVEVFWKLVDPENETVVDNGYSIIENSNDHTLSLYEWLDESNDAEFILCAAIMYKGVIVPGRRHRDCIKLIESLVDVNQSDIPGREAQGFITSHDRYVSREEAFKIAKANNQFCHTVFDGIDEGSLNSEDLYEDIEPMED